MTTQHDFNISNQSGPLSRADINNALMALVSLSAGSPGTLPSTFAHMLLQNTDVNRLQKRNASDTSFEDFFNATAMSGAEFGPFTNLASASTADLGSVASIGINVTGSTAITSFGTGAKLLRFIKFASVLTLTHDGSSLILPTGANIATAAGDTAIALSDASGNWTVIAYHRANGKPLTAISASDISSAVLAALSFGPFTDLASASTADLSSIGTIGIRITGTTNITSFGSGQKLFRVIKFAAALSLVYNSTSLILPGGANITTEAGDTALVMSDNSGNWTVLTYQRANAHPLTAALSTVASASTVTLGYADQYTITGTTAITSFGSSPPIGAEKTACFSGALTLTHGSNLILPGAANITTAAGDVAKFRYEGSGVWRCTSYMYASGSGAAGTIKARGRIYWSGSVMVLVGTGNISSVTRNSLGVYTVNFTTAMPNANYQVINCAGGSAAATIKSYADTLATGSFKLYQTLSGGAHEAGDDRYIDFVVLGA